MYFTKRDLIEELMNTGFSTSYTGANQRLYRMMGEGKFTPPILPGGRKWILTGEHILQIRKAFSPGGKGEWHFEGR